MAGPAAVSRAYRMLALWSIVLTGAVATGCGGSSTTSTAPASEVTQRLPKLPDEWKPHRGKSIGYAIGVPPGWALQEKGEHVLIRSPSHLVAVTLTVNRDFNALALPIDQFATRSLASIPGFENELRPSKPEPFGGTPLEAVETTANGTTKGTGIEESVTVIVLRRPGVVNYAVAVAENAQRSGSKRDRAVAQEMVRTLRDQPVEAGAAPGSR